MPRNFPNEFCVTCTDVKAVVLGINAVWQPYRDGMLLPCSHLIFPLRQRIVRLEIRSLYVADYLLFWPCMNLNWFSVRTPFFTQPLKPPNPSKYLSVIVVSPCGCSFKIELVNDYFPSSFYSLLCSMLTYAFSNFLPHLFVQITPLRRPPFEVVCEFPIQRPNTQSFLPSVQLTFPVHCLKQILCLFLFALLVRMMEDHWLRFFYFPYGFLVVISGNLFVWPLHYLGSRPFHKWETEPFFYAEWNQVSVSYQIYCTYDHFHWSWIPFPYGHTTMVWYHCTDHVRFGFGVPYYPNKRPVYWIVTLVVYEILGTMDVHSVTADVSTTPSCTVIHIITIPSLRFQISFRLNLSSCD